MLQEQQVLLTAAPSLQPGKMLLVIITRKEGNLMYVLFYITCHQSKHFNAVLKSVCSDEDEVLDSITNPVK